MALHTTLSSIIRIYGEQQHRVHEWRQRLRTRRYLRCMSAELMQDAGISESAREDELHKPFWRA